MKIEGLNALGEFIEDCEFPQLSVKILQLLGELAPTTPHPDATFDLYIIE